MKIDISNKLSEIERYKEKCEEWKKNHLVWNPFHKDLLFRLSWNSNSLEGNTLSLEETIQVIEYDECDLVILLQNIKKQKLCMQHFLKK